MRCSRTKQSSTLKQQLVSSLDDSASRFYGKRRNGGPSCLRETWEEARATPDVDQLYIVTSIPRINQVYVVSGILNRGQYNSGRKVLRRGFSRWRNPWDELAFLQFRNINPTKQDLEVGSFLTLY